jgi:hypothetical protein
LSVKLPKKASPLFPKLFEALERMKDSIGLLSFGIETTTLEEVFMRIINEDSETAMKNRETSNSLLGGDIESYKAHLRELELRDSSRNPLKEDMLQLLLAKGHAANQSTAIGGQIGSLLMKRFFQFVRSSAQIVMGALIPFGNIKTKSFIPLINTINKLSTITL